MSGHRSSMSASLRQQRGFPKPLHVEPVGWTTLPGVSRVRAGVPCGRHHTMGSTPRPGCAEDHICRCCRDASETPGPGICDRDYASTGHGRGRLGDRLFTGRPDGLLRAGGVGSLARPARRSEHGSKPTPEQRGVMVLRLSKTPPLDLDLGDDDRLSTGTHLGVGTPHLTRCRSVRHSLFRSRSRGSRLKRLSLHSLSRQLGRRGGPLRTHTSPSPRGS